MTMLEMSVAERDLLKKILDACLSELLDHSQPAVGTEYEFLLLSALTADERMLYACTERPSRSRLPINSWMGLP